MVRFKRSLPFLWFYPPRIKNAGQDVLQKTAGKKFSGAFSPNNENEEGLWLSAIALRLKSRVLTD